MTDSDILQQLLERQSNRSEDGSDDLELLPIYPNNSTPSSPSLIPVVVGAPPSGTVNNDDDTEMTTPTTTATTTDTTTTTPQTDLLQSDDILKPALTTELNEIRNFFLKLWFREESFDKTNLILIGFSKGCVVLNQVSSYFDLWLVLSV